MKKIVLISTFCDTKEKLECLSNNLIKIKELGLDSMIISPLEIPLDIIKLSDYCIITKDNKIIQWPEHSMSRWSKLHTDIGLVRLDRTVADYGFAGIWQIKQMSSLALSMDYDMFYIIIYDTIIDQNVIDCFNSNSKFANVYSSIRESEVWEVGLHLLAFNRKNMKLFADLITKDGYLKTVIPLNGDVFDWLREVPVKQIPCKIENTPIYDKIDLYRDFNFHNYSPTSDFSLFIQKCDYYDMDVKILIYNRIKEVSFEIIKNKETILITANKDVILDIATVEEERNISYFAIKYNDKTFDLTSTLKNIGCNQITIIDDKFIQ